MQQHSLASKTVRLGWIVWGVALSAQFLNQFHRVAASVVIDKLMADFATTATTIGSVLAMYFYVYAIMQFPSGVFADYLGPRKSLSLGCLVASLGSLGFGLASSLSYLYIGRFLLSSGMALVLISVLKIQTQWFPTSYFGRLSSLTSFVGMSGSLVGTTPMALLVVLLTWRTSFELVGIVSFVICLICWFLIRDKPSDLGLPSPTERLKVEKVTPIRISFIKRLKIVLSNKNIWPPFLVGLGSYGTLLVFQGAWGMPYLMQIYSMTRESASKFMLIVAAGAMAGTVIIAFISDKLQRRKFPAIVAAFMYLAVWILLTIVNGGKPPLAMLYPLCFSIGFFSGFTILSLACAKEVVPSLVSGIAMGIVNTGIFLVAGVLQLIFGKILDLGWQGAIAGSVRIYPLSAFHAGFIFICGGALIYVVGALLLKETYCNNISDE